MASLKAFCTFGAIASLGLFVLAAVFMSEDASLDDLVRQAAGEAWYVGMSTRTKTAAGLFHLLNPCSLALAIVWSLV